MKDAPMNLRRYFEASLSSDPKCETREGEEGKLSRPPISELSWKIVEGEKPIEICHFSRPPQRRRGPESPTSLR